MLGTTTIFCGLFTCIIQTNKKNQNSLESVKDESGPVILEVSVQDDISHQGSISKVWWSLAIIVEAVKNVLGLCPGKMITQA